MKIDKRIALLYNFIPPHRIAVFQEFQKCVAALRIFLSSAMEDGRLWKPDFRDLDAVIQCTVTRRYTSHSSQGFTTELNCHVPLDTFRLLGKFKPDAILSLEFGMRTLQSALYTLAHHNTKLVIWANVSEVTELPRGRVRLLLRKALLKFAAGVLVNGTSGRRYIESLGYPAAKIHVVPKTTEIEMFRGDPERSPRAAGRVLYVGQLIERKGIVPFLIQLASWANRNPHRAIAFTLLGSGPLRDALQSQPLPANLSLRICEHVPYIEVGGHYQEADIFAFPTLADEWGIAVNEALIAGLPVLGSTYSQAVEDLVVPGVNGWTFRTDDAEGLYSAIDAALCTRPEELARMRRAAIRTVEHMTPRAMAEDMLKGVVAAMQN